MSKKYLFLANQLNEVEMRVVMSIIDHIENNERKIGIAQIASENFVSTSFIVKMCKKLGYRGYTDFVYKISQNNTEVPKQAAYELEDLLDNYNKKDLETFYSYITQFQNRKCFVVGEGFGDIIAEYIAQRLAVCGFMVFTRVHFYDYMVFKNNGKMKQANIEPALIIAISQSGETDAVINDVRRAKQAGFKVASFTKMKNSSLANLSDIVLCVDEADQAVITSIPNTFFGKVLLAFEEIMGNYFNKNQ